MVWVVGDEGALGGYEGFGCGSLGGGGFGVDVCVLLEMLVCLMSSWWVDLHGRDSCIVVMAGIFATESLVSSCCLRKDAEW